MLLYFTVKKAWGKTYKSKINQNTDFDTGGGRRNNPQQKNGYTWEKLLMAKPLNSSDLNLSTQYCFLMPSCSITSYVQVDRYYIKMTGSAGTIHLTINLP